MNEDLQKAATEFLSTEEGKRIAGKRGELEKLAESADGKRVRALLDGDKLQKAAESGDMNALSALLSGALNTEEGARLAKRLQNLIK
jgi:hypothetical protein